MELPVAYLEELRLLLGQEDLKRYRDCMGEAGVSGLRLNPLKVPVSGRERVLGAVLLGETPEEVPWSLGEGFYCPSTLDGDWASPGKHLYYHAGLYYLQEPSAMAPAALLSVKPGDRVLDLCAAPGGKSTMVGARLSGEGLLVSNDRSVSRARGLLRNLERFGIGNCLVTAEEPKRLADCFSNFFDKILVDAPCSGEGMFRREPSMISDWEERGPAHYVPIQRELLLLASGMLRPGGLLLYSTCTFSEQEDEGAAAWLLAKAPCMEQVVLSPEHGFVQGRDGASLRLYPWRLKGEGHFAALFRKRGDGPEGRARNQREASVREHNEVFLKKRAAFAGFRERVLMPLEERGTFWERDGEVYLLPVFLERPPALRYLRTGLHLGTEKRGRFEPSQALAMYLKKEEFVSAEDIPLEDVRTVKFLKGETITAEGPGEDGWRLVCVDGWPLGFARRNGEMLKNKRSPGWRWQ